MSFPITLTAEAQEHLKKLLARKGDANSFIRVGVKGGGCSGLEYVIRIETARRADDLVFHGDGLDVLCDPKSAEFLQGATLVYTGNLIGGGFTFENPNAKRNCGCGTSFTPIDKTA